MDIPTTRVYIEKDGDKKVSINYIFEQDTETFRSLLPCTYFMFIANFPRFYLEAEGAVAAQKVRMQHDLCH